MDIDRLSYQVEAKDGDPAKKVAYLRQVGSAGSAFEHAVPERLFADPTKPPTDPSQPQGISAVKAIAIAAANGQKIYTLNSQNQAYHQSVVQGLNTDAETKTEITNALNAGLEVTVHQADITAHGWTGSGYILLDPETGAGAYKISGGMNGGVQPLGSQGNCLKQANNDLYGCQDQGFPWGFLFAFSITSVGLIAGLTMMLVTGPFWLGAVIFAWEFVNAWMWLSAINDSDSCSDFSKANSGQVLVGLFGLIPYYGYAWAGAEGLATTLFGMYFTWLIANWI